MIVYYFNKYKNEIVLNGFLLYHSSVTLKNKIGIE